MDLPTFIFYIIIAIFAVSLSRNLIYIFSGPFYTFTKSRALLSSKKYTQEEIEERIKISVIVPAWNEEVGVLNSIKSLLSSSYNHLEVILVDDGSTDKTAEVVDDFIRNNLGNSMEKGKEFRFYTKDNGGKGNALNYGIKKSTGNLIVTMDADTVFDKNALYFAAQYFIDGDLDAAVGNVKVGNSNSFLGIIQEIEYILGFYFKRTHAIFNCEYIIGGAFGLFRRDVFEKYGYFDEINKTEDIELSTRLQVNGCKIAFIEEAISYTEVPSSLVSLMRQRLRWKKGRLDTFYLHKELFFSRNKNHNKFLSFYFLPITLFYELELIIEPFLIIFVSIYFFTTGDIRGFLFWMIFVGIMHVFAFMFGENNNKIRIFAFLPIYLIMSYILVLIEIYAMYASIKLFIIKKDISWQIWKRKGITPQYIANLG